MTSGIPTDLDSLQDLRYTYDANGNIETIQDYKAGTPQTQTFTYDALDRLASAGASGGSYGNYGPQEYSYHPVTGNLSSRAGVSYTYGDGNHAHAVTSMSSGPGYTYDANGNQVQRNNIGGSNYTLTYNQENQLTGVSGADTATFVYDGDGKRVKASGSYMNLAAGKVPSGDVSLNNPAAASDNDPWADSSSQYTGAGSGLHYIQIDLGAVYSVNKVNLWHYANDGRTYHSTKTQVSTNGTTWVTVYDSAVSGEYPETAQGKTISFATQNVRYVRDYVNGNTTNIYDHWTEIEVWGYGTITYVGNYFEWTGSTGTMQKYYDAGDNRVAERRGDSSLYYLLGDHLGSQAITADASGGKITQVMYYPWGEDRYYAYTSSTTYRFTGQRMESGIGLYYYGARWYDAYLNRWIQPDSIIPDPINSQDWDRYAYARNNPLIYIDPDGHNPCDPKICGYTHDFDEDAGASAWLQQLNKENSLEIAEKYRELAEEGTTIYWEGLSKSDQAILLAGGWDPGSYNAHVSDRGVSQADVLHDPVTYILIIVGGGGTAKALLPWIIPSATNTSANQATDLNTIANDIEEWVGQGEKPIALLNKAGDFILRNVENTRRFQAHFNNYSPHDRPHFHLDLLNEVGEWITKRIFPSIK